MNMQFAVDGTATVYILEANPRATRTVPFVVEGDRACRWPASRRGDGRQDARRTGRDGRGGAAHFSVKESVFPFNKFPGVDIILGPEMHSTGEVMGIDATSPWRSPRASSAPATRFRRGDGVHLGARPRQGGILGADRASSRRWAFACSPRAARRSLSAHGIRARKLTKCGGAAEHHRPDEERPGAAGVQYHRRGQGACRFQGYSAYCLALPYSLLYNFGWVRWRRLRPSRPSQPSTVAPLQSFVDKAS